MEAVFNERVNLIFNVRSNRVLTALALNPVPTGVIRTVFVLADADEVDAGVEYARPPPSVPRNVRITRKIGVDAEAIVYLARSSRDQMIRRFLASSGRSLPIHGSDDGQGER